MCGKGGIQEKAEFIGQEDALNFESRDQQNPEIHYKTGRKKKKQHK